jgi:hypothetical protein
LLTTFGMCIPTVGWESSLVQRDEGAPDLAGDVGGEVAAEAIAIIFCCFFCLVSLVLFH